MTNLSKLDHHAFPAYLKDMDKDDEIEYSKTRISAWMAHEIAGNEQGPCGTHRKPLTNFFDGTETPFDPSVTETISWTGFPSRVSTFWGDHTTINGSKYLLRWGVADSSRIYQDEYLEWSVARVGYSDAAQTKQIVDPNPNPLSAKGDFECDVVYMAFTCEGPEYWQFLAEKHPDLIAGLYNNLNPILGGSVKTRDLFLTSDDYQQGVYNPTNYYNFGTTSGTIAHLIHPSNTLGAEIDIAAQATVVRERNGKPVANQDDLINCSQYGNAHRNSDPTIGYKINQAVRSNPPMSITVADPVALYMHDIDLSNFQLDFSGKKDGSGLDDVPDGVFRWTRGDPKSHMGLRFEVSIPSTVMSKDGKPLTVSDIWDTNTSKYIHYGAQVADYVTMSVTANAIPGPVPKAQTCPCDKTVKHTHPVAMALMAHVEGKQPANEFNPDENPFIRNLSTRPGARR